MSPALAPLQLPGGALLALLFFGVLGVGLILTGMLGGAGSASEGVARGSSPFPARALCVIGLSFALVGAFFVSIATDVLAIVLGMIGYALGARILGAVVVFLSIVTLFVGLAVGPIAIPGSYDRQTDGISRPSSGE